MLFNIFTVEGLDYCVDNHAHFMELVRGVTPPSNTYESPVERICIAHVYINHYNIKPSQCQEIFRRFQVGSFLLSVLCHVERQRVRM